MRKAAVLFLVGLSPFLLGWLLSLGMTTIFAQMGAWFYIVVGLAVLTLWMVVSGTFGFKGSKRGMALKSGRTMKSFSNSVVCSIG
mgnify:CR=1 FL=1